MYAKAFGGRSEDWVESMRQGKGTTRRVKKQKTSHGTEEEPIEIDDVGNPWMMEEV